MIGPPPVGFGQGRPDLFQFATCVAACARLCARVVHAASLHCHVLASPLALSVTYSHLLPVSLPCILLVVFLAFWLVFPSFWGYPVHGWCGQLSVYRVWMYYVCKYTSINQSQHERLVVRIKETKKTDGLIINSKQPSLTIRSRRPHAERHWILAQATALYS